VRAHALAIAGAIYVLVFAGMMYAIRWPGFRAWLAHPHLSCRRRRRP
jgi:hypothetical protein